MTIWRCVLTVLFGFWGLCSET